MMGDGLLRDAACCFTARLQFVVLSLVMGQKTAPFQKTFNFNFNVKLISLKSKSYLCVIFSLFSYLNTYLPLCCSSSMAPSKIPQRDFIPKSFLLSLIARLMPLIMMDDLA